MPVFKEKRSLGFGPSLINRDKDLSVSGNLFIKA